MSCVKLRDMRAVIPSGHLDLWAPAWTKAAKTEKLKFAFMMFDQVRACYFGCLKGVSKSVQALCNGTEAVFGTALVILT